MKNISLKGNINKKKYPNEKSLRDGAKFFKAYSKKLFYIENFNALAKIEKNVSLMPKSYRNFSSIIFKELRKQILNKNYHK